MLAAFHHGHPPFREALRFPREAAGVPPCSPTTHENRGRAGAQDRRCVCGARESTRSRGRRAAPWSHTFSPPGSSCGGCLQ